ncbi:MAG: hypothetical protein MMC33_006339 [Icmadophila ericetorum]|nr:hypothetical protein [Icmadophila ericetorum]
MPPAESRTPTPAMEKGDQSRRDRQKIGDGLRLKFPSTRLEPRLSNLDASSYSKNGSQSEAELRIKQESQSNGILSESQEGAGEVWDTDVDAIDDTSTISCVPETQQQAYHGHDYYDPSVKSQLQSQGQTDWNQETDPYSDASEEQIKDEETGGEGSPEGPAVEDDPVLPQGIFTQMLRPEEAEDFLAFNEQKKAAHRNIPYNGSATSYEGLTMPVRGDPNRATAPHQSNTAGPLGESRSRRPQSSGHQKPSSRAQHLENRVLQQAGALGTSPKAGRKTKNLYAIQKLPGRPQTTTHHNRSGPSDSDDESDTAPRKRSSNEVNDRGIQVGDQKLYDSPQTSHARLHDSSTSTFENQPKTRKQNFGNGKPQEPADETSDVRETIGKHPCDPRRSHSSLSDIAIPAPTNQQASMEDQEVQPHSAAPSDVDHQEDATSPMEDIVAGTADIKLVKGNKKRALELDYVADQLSQMPYSDLKSQPFNHDPHAQPISLPKDLTSASLSEKLSYLASNTDRTTRDSQQKAFYASLSIDDYEECGSVLVKQLANLVGKFNKLRREKRAAAVEFEAEIAKREEKVREKEKYIEKDLGRLRRMGEDVIRGKGF